MKTDDVLTRKMHSQQYMSVSLTGGSERSETEDGVLFCMGRNPASAECKVNPADTCMYFLSLLFRFSPLQVVYTLHTLD